MSVLRDFAAYLRTRIAAERIPCVVVEGRERVERQAVTGCRIVLVPTRDTYAGPPTAGIVANGKRALWSRTVGLEAVVLAVSTGAGAKPQDHHEVAHVLVHTVMRAAYLFGRSSRMLAFGSTGGAFVLPDEATVVEQHAEYRLELSFTEAIYDVAHEWATSITPAGSSYLAGESPSGVSVVGGAAIAGDEPGC